MFAFFNWLSFDWIRGKSSPSLDTIPEEENEIPVSTMSQEWQDVIQQIDELYSSFPLASLFAICVLESLDKNQLACPVLVNKLSSKDGIKISWLKPDNMDWQVLEIDDPTSYAKVASVFTVRRLGEEEFFLDHNEDVAAYLKEKLFISDNTMLNRFAKDQN